MILKINNQTINIKEMNTFKKRFLGLMFKKNIKDILIFKTNAIHTFFCLEPIDIMMLDKDKNIKYIYKKLKPFRIIFPKKHIKYTIEMPKGSIEKYKINNKTKISLK